MADSLTRLRNFGIIAHIDAGKTTTTERILFFSGSSHRIGEVDDGTAVMDWMEQERERGITITSAVTTTSWSDHTLNIVDTPGHVDFTAEVQRSLRVLDGAIVVICGVGGVEPQSEKVWHQATEYRVPRLVFVNKLDRLGADFERTLDDLEEKLGGTFVPLVVPVEPEAGYVQALDLLGDELLTWTTADDSDEPTRGPVPSEWRDRADAGRERIVEAASLADEGLLDAFLEDGSVETERAVAALRQLTLQGDVYPVLAGTSLKNRGVRLLLDATVAYLPSPQDVPPVSGLRPGTEKRVPRRPEADEPLAALVYKVMHDETRNRLYYARIYSGTLERGAKVRNPDQGVEERITRIYRMHSNRKEPLDAAHAGDIVALVGPKKTVTGNTLSAVGQPVILEAIDFPEPVIAVSIEPKSQGDLAELEKALRELAVEDPTFVVRDDPETGQKIISGMGELHLQILVDRLLREFKVEARIGAPQVAYRETIAAAAQGRGTFDREIADRLHRATVSLALSPAERGSGFSFIPGDTELPAEAGSWIEEACRDAMNAGSFAGYPLIDIAVQLVGVELPGDAATEIAVRGATAEAFRAASHAGGPTLLEPVVQIEVLTPDDYAGEVLKDLNARRATVLGLDSRENQERTRATVALSRMFGYATDLRSLTRGRGQFTMEISHFEPAEEAMAKFRGE